MKALDRLSRAERTLLQTLSPSPKTSKRAATQEDATALSPRHDFLIALKALIDERISALSTPQPGRVEAMASNPEFLSVVEVAAALQVSEQTVRNLEAKGELFSILSPVRKRGRRYPAFQVQPRVTGSRAFLDTLKALQGLSALEKYDFFTTPQEKLRGLSPVALWTGQRSAEALSGPARLLLRASLGHRDAAIYAAAAIYTPRDRDLQSKDDV
jgi:hypothetical protein